MYGSDIFNWYDKTLTKQVLVSPYTHRERERKRKKDWEREKNKEIEGSLTKKVTVVYVSVTERPLKKKDTCEYVSLRLSGFYQVKRMLIVQSIHICVFEADVVKG